MKPILEKLWLNDHRISIGRVEIRADWSNGQHHGIVVEPPYGRGEVSAALHEIGTLVMHDKCLEDTQ